MEVMYLGHAGLLVKHGDVMVALDPFISGRFPWNGIWNQYSGNSPWIGKEDASEAFAREFARDMTAIAITHAHLDHFDPPTVIALLDHNPAIQILAPRPVTCWLKASSMLGGQVTTFCVPVGWNETIELEGERNSLDVTVIPNPGIPVNDHPERVGYVLDDGDGTCLAYPGDAHGAGPWEHVRDRVNVLVTWAPGNRKERREIIEYFPGLRARFWIHWEPFDPGNFSCGLDVRALVETEGGETLNHEWMII